MDGGLSWTPFFTGGEDILAIWFTTPTTGFAVEEGAFLYRTTDGGLNWTSQFLPVTFGMADMFFPDQNIGYMVGAYGTMIKTIDGGNTWTSLNTGTTNDLVSVYFVSPTHGFIGGVGSEVYETLDGGLTWITHNVPGLFEVGNISMQSGNSGWMSEHAGNLYKYQGTTSIPEITTTAFSVFPNPATENVSIYVKDNSKSFDGFIYDTFGKKVKYFSSESELKTLNIEDLVPGIYTIKINTGNDVSGFSRMVVK